jgi:hypothetical protein
MFHNPNLWLLRQKLKSTLYIMSNNRKLNNYKWTDKNTKDLYIYLKDGISPVDNNLTKRKQYEKNMKVLL